MPTLDFSSLQNILLSTGVAFLLGLFISWLYQRTSSDAVYSAALVRAMVILPMLSSLVMLFVGDSLARAFGAAGAMSFIRFRTAVRDAWDIAFVFFAIAAGMSVGTNNVAVGVAGSLVIGGCILLLDFSKYGKNKTQNKSKRSFFNDRGVCKEYVLKFKMAANEHRKQTYLQTFERFLDRYSLTQAKSSDSDIVQMSFQVALKESTREETFINEMSVLEGITKVNLVDKESKERDKEKIESMAAAR